jgi:hypothetical protein
MPQRNDTLQNLPFITIEAAPLRGTASTLPAPGSGLEEAPPGRARAVPALAAALI